MGKVSGYSSSNKIPEIIPVKPVKIQFLQLISNLGFVLAAIFAVLSILIIPVSLADPKLIKATGTLGISVEWISFFSLIIAFLCFYPSLKLFKSLRKVGVKGSKIDTSTLIPAQA